MRTVLLVARRELVTLLRRPSFYVSAAIVPVVLAAITFGFRFISDEVGSIPGGGGSGGSPGRVTLAGYVDHAKIVQTVPDDLAAALRPFASESDAAAALRDGTIDSYFVVAPTYRDDGRVVRVSSQNTFTSGTAPDSQRFAQLLRLNLAADAQLAERLAEPLDLQLEVANGATGTNDGVENSGFSFALATLLMFAIVNGGGWLIQAVAEEKENRTIELVLTSVRPIELMTGKLLGLGVISLLQLVVWLVLGSAITGSAGGPMAGISASVPASTWVLALVYFLLGYLLLGSFMMSLGAIGASVRESGQLSGVITLPVIAPLWFGSTIMQNPDGLFARILSFIPVTAPVTMMLRLGSGPIAPWQVATSIALLLVGVALALWMAARLFRASTLLTGVKPTPRVIWQALRS